MEEGHLPHLGDVDANRVFWDHAAATFMEQMVTSPNAVQMYQQVAEKVLSGTKFDPNTTVLMDFACGNGGFTTPLAGHCKKVVGVDVSSKMVDAYNARMKQLGIQNARALCAELKEGESALGEEKFDAIICGNVYHHVEDTVSLTRTLKSYLKPHGALLVVDVVDGKDAMHVMIDMHSLVHEHLAHRPKNLRPHKGGYTEEQIKRILEEAGMLNFTYQDAFEKRQNDESFAVFLARALCPA